MCAKRTFLKESHVAAKRWNLITGAHSRYTTNHYLAEVLAMSNNREYDPYIYDALLFVVKKFLQASSLPTRNAGIFIMVALTCGQLG